MQRCFAKKKKKKKNSYFEFSFHSFLKTGLEEAFYLNSFLNVIKGL